MATLNSNKKNRQSYLLSVTPINYSLTDGTNIPPPVESPAKQSPIDPPAFRAGPLTSHPATPPNGAMEPHEANDSAIADEDQKANFRSPTSPSSNAHIASSPQDRRRPSGVRRLFSLTNLRSSFSSSRTSLSLPRQSHDTLGSHQQQLSSVNRPSSPSVASTTAPSSRAPSAPPPKLRQQKSGGNWFKRKSSMFLNGELEAVDENQRPDTRESKRLKEGKPAPFLPEIDSLGGGKTHGGDLGWDEQAFKKW